MAAKEPFDNSAEHTQTKIDFTQPITRVEPFSAASTAVTRDNFISFFAYTFALSKGNFNNQALILEWYQYKFNLDYQNIFRQFVQANGFDVMTDVEKNYYLNMFRNVRGHNTHYNLAKPGETDTDISPRTRNVSDNIRSDSDILATIKEFAPKFTRSYDDLREEQMQCDTVQQLLKTFR